MSIINLKNQILTKLKKVVMIIMHENAGEKKVKTT